MARMFNYERADEHCLAVVDTEVGKFWSAIKKCRILPSVMADVMDVKTATVCSWLYGTSQPREHKSIKRIEVITAQLEKAHESRMFPRAATVKDEDVSNWYAGETGKEQVIKVLVATR